MRLLAFLFVTLLSVLSEPVLAATPLDVLEEQARQSLSTEEGLAYETKAVQVFWGDARFMRKCAPPDAPVAAPLDIYVVIEASGSIGEYVIAPGNEVAACIKKHTRHRSFPPPSGTFTLKIQLVFQ